jgi:hypothetical protein
MTPPFQPCFANRARRDGFALLITIVLVAFMVLVLVSLATLTRVETKVAANSQLISVSRGNALMALNMAIGELQKYAGQDQRASVTADISTGSLGSGGGTAKWTGVYGNAADPQRGLSSVPVALQWLVSGNEETNFDPSTGMDTGTQFGRITTAPSGFAYSPSAVATGLDATAKATTTGLKLAGKDAVMLVGPGSTDFSNDTSARANGVLVPLVNLKIAPANVPGAPATGADIVVGRYAWWVGDEGVKARANLVDAYVMPTSAQLSAGTTAAVAALARLAAPQRAGIEAMTDMAAFPVNQDEDRKLLEFAQITSLATATTPIATSVLKSRFHDITFYSRGVLTDSLRGGLKRDLTFAFAQSPADFRLALALGSTQPNPVIPISSMPASDQGPTWEQVYSYSNTDGSSPVMPRAQSATAHGFAPVLVQARHFYGGNTYAGSTGKEALSLYYFPGFVLANPYNVTLAAATYRIKISITGGVGPSISARVVGEATDFWSGVPLKTLLDGMTFELVCPALAPGESRSFTLKPNGTASGEHPWTSAGVYQMENDWEGVSPVSAIAYPTGAEVDEAVVASDGAGIRFFMPSMPTGEGMTYTLLVPTGAASYEVAQVAANLGFVTANSNVATQYVLRTPSGPPGTISMQPDNPRRLQAGVTFKIADLASYQAQHVGYISASYDGLRTPLWSQQNWRASYQPRDAAVLGNNALGNGVLGAISASTPEGFYLNYIVGTVTTPHWAGGVPLKDSMLSSYPLSRDNWQPFNVPRSSSAGGLASIGQLQHFNAAGYIDQTTGNPPDKLLYLSAAYPVGNSRAQPFISRTAISRTAGGGTFYDLSYLLNRQLFDGYFLSMYPQSGTPSASERLTNGRMTPYGDGVDFSDTDLFRGSGTYAAGDELKAASHLMLEGAFNINSTSVEAWRAFLGGLGGTNFNGSGSLTGPFLRSLYQQAGLADPATPETSAVWNGFRDLSSSQLDALAQAIVSQIQTRGPALSLADFVNRRLAFDTTGIDGPLQAALDATTINAAFPATTPSFGAGAVVMAATTTPTAHPTSGLYADPQQLSPSQFEGTAGWVSQADLVQALAPVMTARSDTFRIRAYGEAVNPATGDTEGRAWCEAIVQRVPDYVNLSDSARVAPSAAISENQRFGRRFEIVAFRWLGPDDI